MDRQQIIEFIDHIELFKRLDKTELSFVAEALSLTTYDAGAFLFEENKKREKIYLIYEGEVELLKNTGQNKWQKLSYFTKYDFLGEGSLTEENRIW